MRVLVALLLVLVVSILFHTAIRKHPGAFYLVALALCAVYFASFVAPDLRVNYWYATFLKVMQRGTLGFALITVVMYIGVLPQVSRLRDMLGPIRRQLSIAGCIMLVPHIVFYARSYLASNVLSDFNNVAVSLVLAMVLVVVGLMLFVTSFLVVRHGMSPATWKRVQRSSYVFFGLMFVHLLLFLLPSVLAGRAETQLVVAIYLMLGIVYAVLRIVRHVRDCRGLDAGASAGNADVFGARN